MWSPTLGKTDQCDLLPARRFRRLGPRISQYFLLLVGFILFCLRTPRIRGPDTATRGGIEVLNGGELIRKRKEEKGEKIGKERNSDPGVPLYIVSLVYENRKTSLLRWR